MSYHGLPSCLVWSLVSISGCCPGHQLGTNRDSFDHNLIFACPRGRWTLARLCVDPCWQLTVFRGPYSRFPARFSTLQESRPQDRAKDRPDISASLSSTAPALPLASSWWPYGADKSSIPTRKHAVAHQVCDRSDRLFWIAKGWLSSIGFSGVV